MTDRIFTPAQPPAEPCKRLREARACADHELQAVLHSHRRDLALERRRERFTVAALAAIGAMGALFILAGGPSPAFVHPERAHVGQHHQLG